MSPNGHDEEQPQSGGFTPARLTVGEFQGIALFFKTFLAENPTLKVAIIGAGIGGACEALHVFWLALRFIFRF